jgi:hypothetical protein
VEGFGGVFFYMLKFVFEILFSSFLPVLVWACLVLQMLTVFEIIITSQKLQSSTCSLQFFLRVKEVSPLQLRLGSVVSITAK